jgi:hypothetical protein
MMHHDAITGTSTGYVAIDYERMMSLAIKNNTIIWENALIEYFNSKYDINLKNEGNWK